MCAAYYSAVYRSSFRVCWPELVCAAALPLSIYMSHMQMDPQITAITVFVIVLCWLLLDLNMYSLYSLWDERG